MSVLTLIAGHGVVPVVVIDDAADAEALGSALVAGGLPVAEITFRTDAAPASIGRLVRAYPDMLVGAGTVLSEAHARAAVDAGARFVVSPGFDEAVVEWCIEHEVPVIPGAMTPTEVTAVVNKGLDVVKFFPAEAGGGIAALGALAGTFPAMRFMPTGGIDAATLPQYLSVPAVVAVGGSWMVKRSLIADGDFEEIERRTREAVATVRAVREQ